MSKEIGSDSSTVGGDTGARSGYPGRRIHPGRDDRRRSSTGEIIFNKGEPPRAAYLIQAGSVNIVVGEGEDATVVGTLKAGDLLGEMALVDAQPRSATAEAKQPTVVVVITAIEFAKRLEKSHPFVRSMVRVLTQRLRNMTATSNGDG